MDQDLLINQLTELAQMVQNEKEQTKVEFEKLQVALTGVLKLLTDEQNSPLTRLKGSPQDLKGYIIRLVSELQLSMLNRLEDLNSKINQLIQHIRNP
jgi:hypothetical protein